MSGCLVARICWLGQLVHFLGCHFSNLNWLIISFRLIHNKLISQKDIYDQIYSDAERVAVTTNPRVMAIAHSRN